MGCNTSSVVPLSGDSGSEKNGGVKVRVDPSTPERKKTGELYVRKGGGGERALESAEPPEELLTGDFNFERRVPVPPPVSFEIPIHENGDSIIRKHPPKRLRRLEDNQLSRELTHELIDVKQEEAEIRRNELLQHRMQSANQNNRHIRKLVHSDAFSQDSEEL